MLIKLISLVSMNKIPKDFLLRSETSEDDKHEDKRIISWPPFVNTVYNNV